MAPYIALDKMGFFQSKSIDIFLFSPQKHMLWVYLVEAPHRGEIIFFFFFFLIWVLRPFQEYFTYIEPIVHRRWAKTRVPGEKPPDHP